jgi:subtilisin family serine protease
MSYSMPKMLRRRGPFGVLAAGLIAVLLLPPSGRAAAMTGEPPAGAGRSATDTVGQLVVKVAEGGDITEVNRILGSTTGSTLLASRGIYLLQVPLQEPSSDPAKRQKSWTKQAKALVEILRRSGEVVYAEPNTQADLTEGNRFHYWPSGGPQCLGTDAAAYTGQPASVRLQLAQVHRRARGASATVAVLDTGVDAAHPALAGRIVAGGYDYVDDDAQPAEATRGADEDADGLTDEGYGHGTFVAGIVALVAPAARILPQRVLDAEGRGNVFTVAEAIYEAVEGGADVINLSFGTADKVNSRVLQDAVKSAQHDGAVVVAAAGNDASTAAHYPAALGGVVSVAAQAAGSAALASFSARGGWVDLAAPGEHIVSALPCGYAAWSGTSMAAPFVSGATAVLVGLRPKVKAATVVKALDDGSDKVRGLQVHNGAMNLRRSLDRLD